MPGFCISGDLARESAHNPKKRPRSVCETPGAVTIVLLTSTLSLFYDRVNRIATGPRTSWPGARSGTSIESCRAFFVWRCIQSSKH